VIVIWPELPSAMQSGVFCASGVGAGLARDPFMPSARVAPTARAGPGLLAAAAIEPVAGLFAEGLLTPG
jgi:hypothetical protein